MKDKTVSTAKAALAQAKRELGPAAERGNLHAAAIISNYEQDIREAMVQHDKRRQSQAMSVVPPLKAGFESPAPLQSSTEIERLKVLVRYEKLDAGETRKEFDRLDGALQSLGNTVACTVNETIPLLSDAQTLMSQRGDRKAVLADAELPRWTEYLASYADRYGLHPRTLRRKIAAYRGQEPSQPKGTKTPNGEPDIIEQTLERMKNALDAARSYIRSLEDAVYYAKDIPTERKARLDKYKQEWRSRHSEVLNMESNEEAA